ncbi:MAG: RloB family protein [Actinomycetota bacterium]|nr:RloB family protein [Actinomycetota bacterium]
MRPRRRGGGLGRAGSRPPRQRRGNRVFYLVAEGEGTEYDYVRRLNGAYGADLKFLIRMPPPATRRNGLLPSRVVQACSGADPDFHEVWGLFDHDGRSNIDQVCACARGTRVKVALSHPAFELWLLLHFQDFTASAQHGKNGLIIDKLRAHPAFEDFGGGGDKRISDARFRALTEDGGIQRAVRRPYVGRDTSRVSTPVRHRATATPPPICTC